VNAAAGVLGVTVVSIATVAIGAYGLRFSRTTSDFYVASRSVGPTLNASAISGEYLSAASFLGVAGLVLAHGTDMLWYPVGWTAGYLVLLVLVAAPLRRSGAYTLPDFADFRLDSRRVRHTSSALVVLIGILYLMPQFQGAGITLRAITGAPKPVGAVVVAVIVLVNVLSGGMRSITFVQAFQYWLKLTALLVPAAIIFRTWAGNGSPSALDADEWIQPMTGNHSVYVTYSLILATFLGTMGLPHVVVRFYTNPDGRAARRTTVVVLGLLSLFYLLPPIYGFLGRVYAPDLVAAHRTDSVVLELPSHVFTSPLGDMLTALVSAGAFAAFLSTSSGLTVSVAGVISQELVGSHVDGVRAFRIGTVVATVISLTFALASTGLAVANAVELAFAVAASTFCPLLLLGIWWRGLTAYGAGLGLVVGGALSGGAVLATLFGYTAHGWYGVLLSQPAAWTVPASFAAMIIGSLATRHRQLPHIGQVMVRLHTPEHVDVDRGTFHPEMPRPR
jgi:Na+(H+)/acetate symporter ActP